MNINANSLSKLTDYGQRVAIMMTGLLPLSTRSILFKVISAPFLIPLRLFQSYGPDFSKKISEYMIQDWTGGITDFYTDLTLEHNSELEEKVLNENFRYSAYMYAGSHHFCYRGHVKDYKSKPEKYFLLSPNMEFPSDVDKEVQNTLLNVQENLTQMGFEAVDANYYHEETKISFNVAYDYETKEVVFCFMAIYGENIFRREKGVEGSDERWKMALYDWIGGIPTASLQAIEIGEKIKKATAGTGITPVMVGHSHGGGFAQAAAAANGLKSVVFNSRPMGPGMRRYIGQSKIAENGKNMIAFSTSGDWLTANKLINLIAILFERIIGIVVPRNLGVGYRIGGDCSDHENFHDYMWTHQTAKVVRNIRSWLDKLYDYKFYSNNLFQINFNGTPLEIEANGCSGKIVISTYMTLNTDTKDWFDQMTLKHPQMRFEYSQLDQGKGKIFLTCYQSFDGESIKNENQFRDTLNDFKKEILETEDSVKKISTSYEVWANSIHNHFYIEGNSLKKGKERRPSDYWTLFPNRTRNGFGIIKSHN